MLPAGLNISSRTDTGRKHFYWILAFLAQAYERSVRIPHTLSVYSDLSIIIAHFLWFPAYTTPVRSIRLQTFRY